MSEGELSEVPKFPKEFVRAGDASAIPCTSKMSPTGTHFYAQIDFRGDMRSMCRFCGARQIDTAEPVTLSFRPPNEVAKTDKPKTLDEFAEQLRAAVPVTEPGKEAFEQPVSRAQAASIAAELSGQPAHAYRRKVGKRKICILQVEQGGGKVALLFEGSDWWIALRGLYSFLKNRGKLSGPDDGGETVPA